MVPDVLFRTPAYIDSVVARSPASEAGLKPDDLVLFVGNELMQSIRQMKLALGRLQAGDRLRIVVRRGEELLTIELPVPRKPTAE
jgi:serine protease Do